MSKLNIQPMDEHNSILQYIKLFREIAKQEIRDAGFDRSVEALVASTPYSGSCDIQLLSEGDIISGVKIRNGLTVTTGDEVYVKFIKNSSSNFFIDEKK